MVVRSALNGCGNAALRSAQDRRDSYRLVPRRRRAWLRRFDGSAVELCDLSGSGGAIALEPHEAPGWDARETTVHLGPGREFLSRLRLLPQQRTADGKLRFGVCFQALPFAGQRLLAHFLIDEECARRDAFDRFLVDEGAVRSEDAAVVQRLLKLYTLQRCETLRVYADDRTVLARRLAVKSIDAQGVLAVELGHGAQALCDGERYGFVASGEGSVLAFRTRLLRVAANEVRLELPSSVVQSGFRDSARCPVSASDAVHAELWHPALDRRVRHIDELSVSGFSVRLDLSREPVCPGARISELRLRVGAHTLSAAGVLRSIDPCANSRFVRCGVELTQFGSPGERELWQQEAFARLHPRLNSSEGATAQAAWQVLQGSAYVSDWADSSDGLRIERAFLRAWGPGRGAMGRLLTLTDGQREAATAAGTWLYPQTWMFHHFGVDRRLRAGQRSFVAYTRELYSGALHEYRHMAGQRYFTLYVERGSGWNERMYTQFAARHRDPSRLRYEPNEVYRCQVDACPVTPPRNPAIRVATKADRAALAKYLATTHSQLELDAMAWSARELAPGALRQSFARFGYERDREIYVWHEGGAPLCALVCETGDEGVNVFGLLNACWLHPLSPEGARPEARAALLARAIEHYRERDKKLCVLFEPEGSEAPEARALGFAYVSAGMHWIAHRDVMPAWLTHVRDVLSLPPGRAPQRSVA